MMIRNPSTTIIAALALAFSGHVYAGANTMTDSAFNPWDLFQDEGIELNQSPQVASGTKKTRFASGVKKTQVAAGESKGVIKTQFAAGESDSVIKTQFAAGESDSVIKTQFAAGESDDSVIKTLFAAGESNSVIKTQFADAGILKPDLCSNDAWNCFNQESVDDSSNCSTDAWSCFSIFASLSPALEE